MAKFIRFYDLANSEHNINTDFIVQVYPKGKYDGNCNCVGTRYIVNVACAGVSCYHAEEYEVDSLTYDKIKEKIYG